MWRPWIERISDGSSERVHLWRLHLIDWPLRCYLHNIQRADSDREMHNHPRPFISLVLRGGYVETTVEHLRESPRLIRRRRGHFNVMSVTRFHRIVGVEPNTWTLMLGRHRTESAGWGFLMDDGTVLRHDEWRAVYDEWQVVQDREQELARVQPNHEHTNGFRLSQPEVVEHLRVQHGFGRFGETVVGQIYAQMLHEQLHTPRWLTKILETTGGAE